MSSNLSQWNKDDIAMRKVLDEFISKKAKWDLNTTEVVQLYRLLVWVASLEAKIENSQAEILAVRKPTKKEKAQLEVSK